MPADCSSDAERAYYCPGTFWAALLTACLIFPLVFVGAGVTSKDAGMAYPDWPTSAGHIVNPPDWLEQDDTRWEHGHRLLGWTVGIAAVATAALAWRGGRSRRLLGLLLLSAIVVQGVLGGMRVNLVSTALAMVHGIWGQLCFCLACLTALVSSRTWLHRAHARQVAAAGFVQKLCAAMAVTVFLQLVFGAALRHFATDAAMVAHLLWAVVVTLVVGWVCMWLIGDHPGHTLLGVLSRLLAILMVAQLMLGGTAFLITMTTSQWSATAQWLIPTIHTAVGALMLSCCVLIAFSTYRLLDELPQETAVTASSITAP